MSKKDIYVYASHEFVPQREDELYLVVGNKIKILEDDIYSAGWFRGECDGQVGYFPINFTQNFPVSTEKKENQEVVEDYTSSDDDYINGESKPLDQVVFVKDALHKTLIPSYIQTLSSIPYKVTHSGFLFKNGGKKSWAIRRRFVVLAPPLLFYFKNSKSSSSPLGMVVVPAYSVIPYVRGFELYHQTSRVYKFWGEEEEILGWIKALLPVAKPQNCIWGQHPSLNDSQVKDLPPSHVQQTPCSTSEEGMGKSKGFLKNIKKNLSIKIPLRNRDTAASNKISSPQKADCRMSAPISISSGTKNLSSVSSHSDKPFTYLPVGVHPADILKKRSQSVSVSPKATVKINEELINKDNGNTDEEMENVISIYEALRAVDDDSKENQSPGNDIFTNSSCSNSSSPKTPKNLKFFKNIKTDVDNEISEIKRQMSEFSPFPGCVVKRNTVMKESSSSIPKTDVDHVFWINQTLFSTDTICTPHGNVKLPSIPLHVNPITVLHIDLIDGVVLIEFLLRLTALSLAQDGNSSIIPEKDTFQNQLIEFKCWKI
jgi:hypothetical protein